MDIELDEQFQRVEKALTTLITSIATYNPNPNLATELAAADQALTRSLKQLSTHQDNYARILALRADSEALDSQIKDALVQLTQTRADLLATPATVFPSASNPVSYSDLLSYARRISKFTRPPTFREEEGVTPPADSQGLLQSQDVELKVEVDTPGATSGGGIAGSDVKTNGTRTPTPTPLLANGTTSAGGVNGEAKEGDENNTALPPLISDWINPHTTGPTFVPWPTEETIRRGALASIQILVDQGVDPATFDPERSAELEAERKRLEEELEAKKEAEMAERRRKEEERAEERRRSMAASMGVEGGATSGRQAPKVFTGLDALDDMDEDD